MLMLILGLLSFRIRLALRRKSYTTVARSMDRAALRAAWFHCADRAEAVIANLREWGAVQFGVDRSTGWTVESLRQAITGEQPLVHEAQHRPAQGRRSVRLTIGRQALRAHHTVHAMGVAAGAIAQRARWAADTQTFLAVA